MKKVFLSIIILSATLKFYAQPGKDGTLTVTASTQIVNHYAPISASISIGDNTLSIATTSVITLCAGDLIMVYQAQGASMNFTNSVNYGNITAFNSAGFYEFKYVLSVSGNVITTQTTFTNSYMLAGRPQVIKVPQYTTLTINPGGSIVPKPWKDTTIALLPYRFGGLVVIHASNIVNNGIISADGSGFRGGTIFYSSGLNTGVTSFVSTLSSQGGEKGESVFGYQVDYDNNGGRYCTGAPANGGGGGDGHNAGGGGGGNGFNGNAWTGEGVMFVDINNPLLAWSLSSAYVANSNALTTSSGGGHGGYSWSNLNGNALSQGPNNSLAWSGDNRREVGGIGGRPLSNINAETRIYFGGGGGCPHADNGAAASGGNGGGIVYLISSIGISGTGTITSGGSTAGSSSGCNCDGLPGGGAGGSIVIKTPSIAVSQNVIAAGGNGGSQLLPNTLGSTLQTEGPGGGGGGGFAAISAVGNVPVVNGGINGITLSPSLTEMISNGSTQGATGQTGTVSALFATYVPATFTIATNAPVCTGATLNFTSAPANTYTWSGPNGFSSFIQNPLIVNATALMAGTYSVSWTFTGACQSSSTQTIAVVVIPTPTISATSSTVCPGITGTLTASGAVTYTWNPGGIAVSSLTTNPAVSTSYTVTGTTASGCTSNATASINIMPTPTIIVSNTIVCPGGTGTLTASGAVNYTWNPGGMVGNGVMINPVSTTVFTVTGTSSSGCTANATNTVIVAITVTTNIAASAPSVCVGNFITLTASAFGGTPAYSYTWTGGPLTALYNTTQPAGSYVYTVTGKDNNNCSATETISINFIAPPLLSVSSVSICPGNSGTLTASGATSYTWRPGNIVVNPIVTSPIATTQYTVTGAAAGCTANATASITIKTIPSLSFATASITCASLGSATVNASGGANGPFTYSWTPSSQTTSIAVNLNPGIYTLSVFDVGSGCTSVSTTTFTSLIPFTGIVASNSLTCNSMNTGTAGIVLAGGSGKQVYSWSNLSGTETSSIAINLSAGIHTVVVIDSVTFCSVTHTFQISQPLPLAINITKSAALACTGSSIILSATGSGGTPGYTFMWTDGPANFLYTPTQTLSGTYVYTVNIRDSNNCPDSANVTLNFAAYPNLKVNNDTICNGALATLSVSGAQAYSWYPGGFTGNTINVSVSGLTIYTVIGNSSGCTSTASAMVLVKTLPVPKLVSSNNVCEGNAISFNSINSGTCTWTGPGGFNAIGQNPVISAATLNNAGTYSLTITDLNGCSASISTLITVYANPVISATGASVCIGEPAILSASGGLTYFWSGPNGYTSNQSSAYISVLNSNATGLYTVFVTGLNSCTSATVVQVAGYNFPLPTPSISASSKICLYSKLNMLGSGGGSYLWSGPANFTSTDQKLDFTVGSLNMSGIYTLTVKNQSNCAASATLLITVYPLPQATVISSHDKTCVPLCTDFGLVPAKNIAPIIKTNFVVENLLAADSAFSYCIQIGGNRLVTAFFTDTNGCVNSSTLNLTVYPQPEADFDYYPENPVENVDEVLFSNASLGENQNKWHWYFVENVGYTSQSDHPSFTFDKSGTFPIAMIVTNTWGCSDTVIKSIVVEEEYNVYVPNSFTPNNDGKNDIFQPKGTGVVTYYLQIYDRWGEKVFSSNEFSKGWDGTFKGRTCENSVYLWKIDVTNSKGKTKNLTGYVSIML